jgi:hypothetical protein
VVRTLVRAVSLTLCILLASLGVQAAAFRRPPPDDLVAARALRTLLGYHVMRATEDIAKHTSPSVCLQGWFPAPRHRHLVRGALVLIGDGERLYDLGAGIRRLGERRRVDALDRLRFVLAGCPRFIGEGIGDALVRSRRIDVDPARADGLAVDSIVFGKRRAPLELLVTRTRYSPVELVSAGGSIRGRSHLEAGGTPVLVRHIRKAFHLSTRDVRRA